MECQFCGSEIAEGALACPRCGSPAGPAPPKPDGQAQGETTPGAPLARQEEDFIAMAEAMAHPIAPVGGGSDTGVTTPLPPPGDTGRELPPGADAGRTTVLDTSLTGGYQDGAAAGASVAGAGEQTADDPFGLKITEEAPPLPGAEPAAGRNWRSVYHMTVGIVAFLLAAAVAYFGLYYGFLREKGPSAKAPAAAVEEFFRQVVSGDASRLDEVALPGTALQAELSSALQQYDKSGVLSLKEFKGETNGQSPEQATVVIERVILQLLSQSGEKQDLDLLGGGGQPFRTTVRLVNQNGRWLVAD